MTLQMGLVIAGIVLCIFLSHFFSSSEMSYSAASEVRLEHEAQAGKKNAQRALDITRNFDDTLSTILIGNNLVNIAASALAAVLIQFIFGDDKLTWVGTLAITVLIIIFGETIPKITSKKKPNILAMRYAPVIRALKTLFFPVVLVTVKLANLITGPEKAKETEEAEDEAVEEFQSIIETAEDEGILSNDSSELLQATIDFSDTSASAVMTPRVDVEAIDIDDSESEIRKIIENTTCSRMPVYEDNIDNIIGVLHVNNVYKSLVSGEKLNIRPLLMEPCFIYKTMKLPDILSTLKENKQHMAIVTNEYGGTHGIVTMEDVLEELVGEIWDESDEVEEELIERGDSLEIDGDMILSDFFEEFELESEEFESETVGGWCIEILGHYPATDENFVYKNLKITILAASERRVEKVLAEDTEATGELSVSDAADSVVSKISKQE